jgi:hypothetical protein
VMYGYRVVRGWFGPAPREHPPALPTRDEETIEALIDGSRFSDPSPMLPLVEALRAIPKVMLRPPEEFDPAAVAKEFKEHVRRGRDPVILFRLVEMAAQAAAAQGLDFRIRIEALRRELERDGYRLGPGGL